MHARRIVPSEAPARDDGPESLDAWGFRDSAFTVLPNGNVTLTGARYELSGVELPYLLPWIRRVMEIDLPPADTHGSGYPPDIPAARDNLPFPHELRGLLRDDAIRDDPELRLRHGHGHTLEEMYQVRHGRLERIPDLVVFPATEEEVQALVELAARHDV